MSNFLNFSTLYTGSGLEAGLTFPDCVVTADAVANTKGAWVDVIASTSYRAQGMVIQVGGMSNITRETLTDIGVGSAGNEVILYPDLGFTCVSNTEFFYSYNLPCDLPAGTRIAARGAASTGSTAWRVGIQLAHQGFMSPYHGNKVTAYGTNSAFSTGTQVADAGTINTEGSWVELTASTTYYMRAMMVTLFGRLNTLTVDCARLLDIGVGAAAAEQVIFPDLFVRSCDTPDQQMPCTMGPFPCNIPAGTRLVARSQGNVLGGTANVIVHGIS